VFDAQPCASFVEGMLTRWRSGLARESVRELAAVVGEQLGEFRRCGMVSTSQQVSCIMNAAK
jgi:hypothetical protein